MKVKKKGWPLWVYLAFLSIVFYLLLVMWFVKTLDGDLKSRLVTTITTDARVAAAIPQYSLQLQPKHTQSERIVDEETDEMTTPKRRQESNRPHIPPRPKKRKEATTKTTNTTVVTKGHTGTLFYGFNRNDVESYLQQHGTANLRQIIGAFLEPETSFVVPGTVNQGIVDQDEDPGMPPQFIEPLPLRTFTPNDLKHFQYPKFQTCHDLPAKLPVDRGLELDPTTGEAIVWNVGNEETPLNYSWDQAPYCPVDADPFLPWIHDVFPNVDGTVLEFIAHNRRRCKTGRKHRPDVLRLEPQVALMQHVSVERITPAQAHTLAPELWNGKDEDSSTTTAPSFQQFRYRLAPMNESSPDGQFTRFLCRFHGTVLQQGNPQSVVIDETLSVFPYNYEFVSYRKGKPTMITPKGKDNRYFWTSVLRFQCPIPKELQDSVRRGETILSDGTPTLRVDLIPIRTPPRFGVDDMYLTEDMIGPRATWTAREWHNWRNGSTLPLKGFDAVRRWGNKNVLPRVEASGRWTNLPICQTPELPQDDKDQDVNKKIVAFQEANEKERGTKKQHLLSACVWASASFKTRGKGKDPILDTGTRLREWIEFHLMVGFDHIYVFDNSGAQTNATSLKPILDQYPKSQISRIEWPSIICNNNIPAHDSTGERSSQYTAENACRTRFAPFTEWIAAFDTDEYLIPAGKHTSLRDVIRNASKKKKTNILTFRSSRARLLYERSM